MYAEVSRYTDVAKTCGTHGVRPLRVNYAAFQKVLSLGINPPNLILPTGECPGKFAN